MQVINGKRFYQVIVSSLNQSGYPVMYLLGVREDKNFHVTLQFANLMQNEQARFCRQLQVQNDDIVVVA